MRILETCLLLLFSVLVLEAGESEFRTFTNPEGIEMEAKLTLVSGDDVYIERRDGLATKVDISIFSKDDQKFIREWAKKDALTSGDVDAQFKTHVSSRSGWESTGGIRRKRWKEGYEVVVENNSDFDMKDVRIEYLVLKFEDAIAAEKRSEGVERKLKGSAKIGPIGKRSTGTVETEQFPMLETKLEPGFYWVGGGKKTSEDEMRGIWVKIYAGDLLVAEVCRPENLSRKYTWDD